MSDHFSDDEEMQELMEKLNELCHNLLKDIQQLLRMINEPSHNLATQDSSPQPPEVLSPAADEILAATDEVLVPSIPHMDLDPLTVPALEHNPEAFATVVMYVDMEVNGIPLKAFVDSGAPSTIISKSCAERLGLLRLLDQRYRGIAHGVA